MTTETQTITGWDFIRRMPTCVHEVRDDAGHVVYPSAMMHESLLRASGVLREVERLLAAGAPGPIVLEVLRFLQSPPPANVGVLTHPAVKKALDAHGIEILANGAVVT